MQALDIIIYIIALSIILIGFFVYRNPDSIAGYNAMSDEQKRNYDIVRFKKILRNILVIGGFLIIFVNLLLGLFKLNVWRFLPVILIFLVICFYIVYKGRNFYTDNEPKNSVKLYWILSIPFLLIVGVSIGIYYGIKETEVIVSSEKIKIKGVYGFVIPVENIQKVELIERLPAMGYKTNGFSCVDDILKGNFRTKNKEDCKLFVYSKHPPFLKIIYNDNQKVYVNLKTTSKTTQLYNEIVKNL